MDSICNQQDNHGIMAEGQEGDDLDSISSSSSSDLSSNSISSSEEFMDDATASSSLPDQLSCNGPLYEMSSLMQQLPFKRGLSMYFQGKSQSFTSLSNVRSLEDLAKPENPYNKKLKPCRSYGVLSESQKPWLPRTNSKIISKKNSRGSCYTANMRRSNSFLGNNRPPVCPHRTNSLIA